METCDRKEIVDDGRTNRVRLALVALLLLLVPLSMAEGTSAAGTATVVIDGGLTPKVITISVGATVTWQGADAGKHRIRSQSGAVQFDSGGLAAGASYSLTFTSVGTINYIDDENKNMAAYSGSVVVIDNVVATVPTPTTPSPTTPSPTPPSTVNVSVANKAFSPASISVAVGATVVWTNRDKEAHTVTDRGGSFDSGSFGVGATWRRTFNSAGTFTYICDIHPSMVGVVSVAAPSPTGTLPPPPPTPTPTPTTPAPTTPPGATPPPAGANSVRMVDFGFQPAVLTVAPGAAVTWSNTGLARHTVAANDGSFHSPDVRSGETFARTFTTPGTYTYICDIHPDMKGTIAVTGAGGEAPPPAPPTTAPPAVTASGDVRIADFSFAPRTITISAGQSLTFVNTGAARHSATAKDGSFDTGLLARGATARKTFHTPGTFPYVCTLHSNMTGTILVTGVNGEAPPPAKSKPVAAVAAGDVQMIDFDFTPSQITVAAGGTVGFVNGGVAPHTATAKDGSWDTGIVRSGGTTRVEFDQPGTFSFYCTIHPQMVGTVLVQGADGAPPPAEAAAAAPAGPPAAVDVRVLAETFEPADVRVAEGGTVTWTIESRSPHIIAAEDESFVSDLITHGSTFEFTFDAPGTYVYHDGLTGEMTGSVTVVADPSSIESGAADDGSSASINIIDLDFDPREVTVAQGAEVTWTNTGQAPHTVAASDQDWTSDLLQHGDQFSHTFEALGRFEYLCTLHPGMVGAIVVTDPAGVPPALVHTSGGGSGNATLMLLIVGGATLGLAAFVIGRKSAHHAAQA